MKTPLTLLLVALTQTVVADLVFQADFDDSSKMVTLGGTGSLYDVVSSDDISSSIVDGKLVITDGALEGTRRVGAIFSPSSTEHSPNAWFRDSSDRLGHDTVHGAFDFFFESTEYGPLSHNSIRAIDVRFGQDDQIRIVFTSNDGGALAVEFLEYTGEGGRLIGSLSYEFYEYQPNTVYHIAVTFETRKEGLVTGKLYVAEGNNAIKTSGYPSDSFMTDRPFNTTGTARNSTFEFAASDQAIDRVVKYDQFRLYNSIPSEFPANQ